MVVVSAGKNVVAVISPVQRANVDLALAALGENVFMKVLPQFCRVKIELFGIHEIAGLSMDSKRTPWTQCSVFSIAD
jgi:hypothetical protein